MCKESISRVLTPETANKKERARHVRYKCFNIFWDQSHLIPNESERVISKSFRRNTIPLRMCGFAIDVLLDALLYAKYGNEHLEAFVSRMSEDTADWVQKSHLHALKPTE